VFLSNCTTSMASPVAMTPFFGATVGTWPRGRSVGHGDVWLLRQSVFTRISQDGWQACGPDKRLVPFSHVKASSAQ
jgi:hypothetical protein